MHRTPRAAAPEDFRRFTEAESVSLAPPLVPTYSMR
jgi:hypothetical protein